MSIGKMESESALAAEAERKACETIADDIMSGYLEKASATKDEKDVLYWTEQASAVLAVRSEIRARTKAADVSYDSIVETVRSMGLEIVNAEFLEALKNQEDAEAAATDATLAERKRCVSILKKWEAQGQATTEWSASSFAASILAEIKAT